MLAQANSIRIPLADESVHAVICSPPYWGLRDYGLPPTGWPTITYAPMPGLEQITVRGCDSECEHEWGEELPPHHPGQVEQTKWKDAEAAGKGQTAPSGQFCRLCAGWRGALGLEPTPELYIAHLVTIFREVWRVLRKDGTCWINIGDSYAGSGCGSHDYRPEGSSISKSDSKYQGQHPGLPNGLKPKDLCMIPARLALALQAEGWWLRNDIIWDKPNPMPESVRDRCTVSHEYVFMLTKAKRYFWDQEAIREPHICERKRGPGNFAASIEARGMGQGHTGLPEYTQNPSGRNKRTVWHIATQPYSGAHFATFPLALATVPILASTSQRGCCPKCGKQWRRVTKPTMRIDRAGVYDGKQQDREDQFSHKRIQMLVKAGREAGLPHDNTVVPKRTLGWRPVCFCNRSEKWPKLPKKPKDKALLPAWEADCEAIWQKRQELLARWKSIPTIPAITLDPFCGSGTVGEACRKLGRRFIALDLSFPYLRDLALPRAERRTSRRAVQTLPLFQGVA